MCIMKRRHIILIFAVLIVLLLALLIFTHFLTDNVPSEPQKFFCTTESRNAVCNDVGDRVCGWFNQSVKCLKYPCAINFNLRCEACKNTAVEYYTFGACPANNTNYS